MSWTPGHQPTRLLAHSVLLCTLLLLLVSTTPTQHVLADTPKIISFNGVSRTQSISFTWKIENAGGYKISVPCLQNVQYLKADNSAYVCDIPQQTESSSGALDLFVYNTTGTNQVVTARLIALFPKDELGVFSEGESQQFSIVVPPISTLIQSFQGSAKSTPSGSQVSFSWQTHQALSGVNIRVDCANDISFSSPFAPTVPLPCGTFIQTTNLPAPNGATSLIFRNANTVEQKLARISLFPALPDKTFDSTRAQNIDLVVEPEIPTNPLFSLIPDYTSIENGATTTVTWAGTNISGFNLSLGCGGALILTTNRSGVSPCGSSRRVESSGSIEISGRHDEDGPQTITLLATPTFQDGSSAGAQTKRSVISVLSKKKPSIVPFFEPAPLGPFVPSISPPQIVPVSVETAPVANTVPLIPAVVKKNPFQFTKNLKRGDENSDVRELQKLLAKNIYMYPERAVHGYYGSPTMRAVARLQSLYAIQSDVSGVVGQKTILLLNRLLKDSRGFSTEGWTRTKN